MELHDKLVDKFRLDINQKKALHRLKLFSIADLLFHFPIRYSDISEVKRIADLIPGDMATIYGKISKLKTKKAFRSHIPMGEGEIEDLSGKIKIIWLFLKLKIIKHINLHKCWNVITRLISMIRMMYYMRFHV